MNEDDTCEASSQASASTAPTQSVEGKTRSEVYTYVKQRVDYTPGGVNKKVVWVCQSCRAKNKDQVWHSRNTHNFSMHLEKHHNVLSKSKRGPAARSLVSFSSAQQEEAIDALVDFIVSGAHPFRLVEDKHFVDFCSRLSPEFRVPVRQTIQKKVKLRWTTQKEIARGRLVHDLRDRRVGLTTDMWTSPAKKGYMVVTMHYIDNSWELQSIIIGFSRVCYPHDGDRLATALLQTIEDMDPHLLSSVWTLTADNATNNGTLIRRLNILLQQRIDTHMAEALPDSAFEGGQQTLSYPDSARAVVRLRCVAHVLQLAVKEGLAACPVVHSTIGRLRDLCKKIHDSPKLAEALESVCTSLNQKKLMVRLDVETRWNSTWEMVERIRQLRRPLEELLRRIRDRHDGFTDLTISPDNDLAAIIPESMWSGVEMFFTFLEPFKEATDMISGSKYPTLGMVSLLFSLMRSHSSNALKGANDPEAVTFITAVQSKLKDYEHVPTSREASIAAALDPRVKALLGNCGHNVENVRREVIREYEAEYSNARVLQPNQSSQSSAQKQNGKFPALQSLMGELGADVATNEHQAEPFEFEYDRWMAYPSLPLDTRSTKVCEWWKTNESTFPRVAMLARDYLAIPATSVPSEIAFSKAGCILSERRARLGDDSVKAISELVSFLSFNNQD